MRFYLGALLLVVAVTAAQAQDAPPPVSVSTQEVLHAEANAARARHGLAPLQIDANLNQLCQNWANHMASRRWMYHGGGENIIACGQTSCRGAINSWLGSPGHRAFVLGHALVAGWGHAVDSNGRHYWAGAFRSGDGEATVQVNTGGGSQHTRWRFFRRRR
jgi:uncharacterized protein YkwD